MCFERGMAVPRKNQEAVKRISKKNSTRKFFKKIILNFLLTPKKSALKCPLLVEKVLWRRLKVAEIAENSDRRHRMKTGLIFNLSFQTR